ncbi:MAG: hypothetical protein ACW98F_04740 [Candidatus Hodarchaeales archaeon]
MTQNDEAYEIIITPLISHETHDRVRKVEAVQTKTLTFFRYIYAALYHGYDAVIEEKFFLNEDKAIEFWNRSVASLCVIPNSPQCMNITA